MTRPPVERAIELGPVVEFLRVVWALDHALTRRSKRMERTMGVTGTQRFVLLLAARRPGISAGELAAVLHLHPSTLTGVLDRLTRRGLLARLPDAADGRRALFRVTDPGRRTASRREGSVEACARKALRRASPADVRAAERVLSGLVEALEEDAC
jgi:DNA-binding MarR family transcriptional regulator